MACRLCGAAAVKECLRLDRAPSSVERLLAASDLPHDKPVVLSAGQCHACGLVQIPNALSSDFYDDYEMDVTFSPHHQAYLADLCSAFIDHFGLAPGRLVEIGCGDGAFLECFRARGFDVTGIEPSQRFGKQAAAKGLVVHATYVDAGNPAPGGPYAALVTRQVVEHVNDLRGFMIGLAASLSPGGVGLIEAPSLEQAVDGARFYDFFPDHLNYFDALTLRRACESHGLVVSDVRRTFGGEYLVAFVRKAAPTAAAGLAEATRKALGSVRQFLRTERLAGRRVAVWGAGGKGVSALAAMERDDVAYVVDADGRKQGLFTPVSHFQVQAPRHLLLDPVDSVLITGLAYRDEIVEQLVNDLGFDGAIVALGPEVTVLREPRSRR